MKKISSLRKLAYPFLIAITIAACSGEKGDPGPAGATGTQGAKGETGATGPAGQNATATKYYDFTLGWSPSAANFWNYYQIKGGLKEDEIALVYLKSKDFYFALPYYDYAYAADDVTREYVMLVHGYGTAVNSIAIKNEAIEDYKKAENFKFRAVILKGIPGGRLNIERYRDYANLKADFNLPE